MSRPGYAKAFSLTTHTTHVPAEQALLGVLSDLRFGPPRSVSSDGGGTAAIDATRAICSALHGFIALEAAGGFGLPLDIDRRYAALVHALGVALSTHPIPQS